MHLPQPAGPITNCAYFIQLAAAAHAKLNVKKVAQLVARLALLRYSDSLPNASDGFFAKPSSK